MNRVKGQGDRVKGKNNKHKTGDVEKANNVTDNCKNFVAASSGADSTALALLLWERGEDFEMIFSDTGAELPEVYWLLPRLARYVNKPLHVVSGGSFFQWLNQFGYMLPSFQRKWCTKYLKQMPQDTYLKSVSAEKVAIGIRADESHRANYPKPRHGIHEFTYPLHDAGLEKKEVLALCAKHDLLNPVYQWRSSVSCFCCPFQRKRDWLNLSKQHPTLYQISIEWEEESAKRSHGGYRWCKSFSLTDLRAADKAQVDMWPEPDGEPCTICKI